MNIDLKNMQNNININLLEIYFDQDLTALIN